TVDALLDTGSDTTCIDPSLVQALGLPVAGFSLGNVPAAGGLTHIMQYQVGLVILHPSGQASQNFTNNNLLVAEVPLNQLGYQALIGRDLLDRCKFVYDGPAKQFSLTY